MHQFSKVGHVLHHPYRKLAAEERAVADKAPPGPWEYQRFGTCAHRLAVLAPVGLIAEMHEKGTAEADLIARSRTAVPALADAVLGLADEVELLRAVVDELPRCLCDAPATKTFRLSGDKAAVLKCDWHAEVFAVYSPSDLPWAAPLRALLANGVGR